MDVYCPFVLNCNSFCSIECAELDDLLAVLEEGLKNRAIGTHNMNEHSSRSHTILTVHIHRWDRITLFKHSNSHQILQRRESFKWWQQRSLYHEVGQSFRIVQNWITRHCKTFSWSDRNGLEHQFSKIFTTFYVKIPFEGKKESKNWFHVQLSPQSIANLLTEMKHFPTMCRM